MCNGLTSIFSFSIVENINIILLWFVCCAMPIRNPLYNIAADRSELVCSNIVQFMIIIIYLFLQT